MSTYLIALGSNRRHARHGGPKSVVRAATSELSKAGDVVARSPIIETAPMGPAQRRFANAACVLETPLDPPALLRELKAVERRFGRRPGQVWGDRVLDLDIALWSGGMVSSRTLTIPHKQLSKRSFVLNPAETIAAEWREPASGLTVRQLAARARICRKPV